jgi:hypothetical protein
MPMWDCYIDYERRRLAGIGYPSQQAKFEGEVASGVLVVPEWSLHYAMEESGQQWTGRRSTWNRHRWFELTPSSMVQCEEPEPTAHVMCPEEIEMYRNL